MNSAVGHLQAHAGAVEALIPDSDMKALFLTLVPLAVFGTFWGSAEPVVWFLRGTSIEPYLLAPHNGNSIVFNLSVGYLVSLFFWLLVVYFPELHQHQVA